MTAPKVTIREIDLSARVPSFPGLYGGIVIPAKKGPVSSPQLITSEQDLLEVFTPNGKIETGYDVSHFSAMSFLMKSNKLWVVRPAATGMLYGGAKIEPTGATASAAFSTGEADPEAHVFTTESFTLVGSNQGAWNNDVRVKCINYKIPETVLTGAVVHTTDLITVTQFWGTGYPVNVTGTGLPGGLAEATTYYVINISPTTIKLASSYANAVAGTSIDLTSAATQSLILSPDRDFTKEPGTFVIQVFLKDDLNNYVEQFIVSKTNGAKDGFNQNLYIEDVLQGSNYIRAIDNPLVTTTTVYENLVTPVAIAGGVDGSAITDGQMIQALNLLDNSNDLMLTVVLDGGRATVNYQQAIIDLCVLRKDCVGILSTPYSAEVSSTYLNSILAYRKTELNANNSYVALFTPHVKIYDKYNDRDIFVSPDGFVGGLISDTANNYEMWYPIGGSKRGVLNVKDVARRFSEGALDSLYDNGINPIKFQPGKGIQLMGQKTLSSRPSSLDRLNVRLLLVTIEPAIKEVLNDFIMDLNDEATRAQVRYVIKSYMDNIKARRGVYAFEVVCDGTNNTPEEIDNHILNVDLFIQPVQSIEFIRFTVVITRTGMDFKLAQAAI